MNYGRRDTAAPLAVVAMAFALGCRDVPTQSLTSPVRPATVDRPALGATVAAPVTHAVVVNRVFSRKDARGRSVQQLRQTWGVPLAAAPSLDATTLMPRPRLENPTPEMVASVLALGVIRAAAAPASAECGRDLPWQRTQVTPDYTLVLRGRGSVPYEELDIFSGTERVGRVRASWRRLPSSWLLASQDYESANGTVRDRVTLAHFDSRGAAETREVTRIACIGPSAGPGALSSSFAVDPFAANGRDAQRARARGQSPTLLGGTLSSSCEVPSDYELETGACFDEWMKLLMASTALVGATATMTAACIAPEPVVTKAACIAAIAAYEGATAAVALTAANLYRCKTQKTASLACSCNLAARAEEPTVPSSDSIVRMGSNSSRSSEECLPDEGSGSDSSGGGGTETVWYTVVICTYEDHYDEYGQYQYSVSKGCYYTLAAT